MEKLKIYATGNERIKGDFNVSYYIIEKNKIFLDWLGNLLEDVLEIKGGKKDAKFWLNEQENDKGEIIGEVYTEKKVSEMNDYHEKYFSKGNRIDLFYGDKRVFLAFRKDREMREKFAKFLIKQSKGISIKEVENQYGFRPQPLRTGRTS